MPGPFASNDDIDLRAAERAVTDVLGGLPLDFHALLAAGSPAAARAQRRRRVIVKAPIMPQINREERLIMVDLKNDERDEPSRLLRKVLRTLDKLG